MFIPDPGSWFLPILDPDLGSRIQKQQKKERGEKKFVVIPFFVATYFTKLQIIFFLMLKKKIWSNFQKIIVFFTQKIVTKLSKIWIWEPGSEIRDPEKTHSGSRGQKGTGSRTPDPDPQHWSPMLQVGPLRKHLGPGCARLLSLGHRWCSIGLLIWLPSAVLSLKVLTSCVQFLLAVYYTLYSRRLHFRTFWGHFKRRFIDIGRKKLFLLLGSLKIFLFLHIPVWI